MKYFFKFCHFVKGFSTLYFEKVTCHKMNIFFKTIIYIHHERHKQQFELSQMDD